MEREIMKRKETQQDFIKAFEKSILVAAGLLVALGLIGILAPNLISFSILVFMGCLMIVGGVFFGYYSYQYHTRSFVGWLKPLILITAGALILIHPGAGIAAFTLVVTLYLFMDAYASFGLAYARHPEPGWGWLLLNGLLSITLAMLLLVGWPETSALFLGIYIGISLLLDGITLLMLGMKMKKAEEEILDKA